MLDRFGFRVNCCLLTWIGSILVNEVGFWVCVDGVAGDFVTEGLWLWYGWDCDGFVGDFVTDFEFQHPGTVQCALFVWLGFHALYLIKETTPYFLFTKYRIFVQNQLADLFLKYRQYFRDLWWCVWRFLKMFLLFRSYHICFWFVTWDSMKILFTGLVVQETCVSRRNIFFRCIFLFVKYIFKRDFGKYISKEYLFQYISEKNIWFKYMCIQKKDNF